MAISTYNYVGINNPSGTHKASKQDYASRAGPTTGTWIELYTGDYDKIESSNNSRYYQGADTAKYALVLCRFVPDEAVGDMTQIKGLAEGYGYSMEEAQRTNGFFLHIWNFNSSTWELLSSHTSAGDQTISGIKNASLANYVDGSGYVYLLLSAGNGFDEESNLHIDYVELEITYTAVTASTVTVSAASNVGKTTARLNGNVTATGGENPTVTMYWGKTDGEQMPGNWTNNSAPTSPGQPQGVASFYKDATGLDPGTLYYFSAKATNAGGTGWPGASLSFNTLASVVRGVIGGKNVWP